MKNIQHPAYADTEKYIDNVTKNVERLENDNASLRRCEEDRDREISALKEVIKGYERDLKAIG